MATKLTDPAKRNAMDMWPYANGEYGMPSFDEVHDCARLPDKESVASRVAHLFDDGIRAEIDKGKLRVVVEVDSCDDTGCSKCGHYTEDQYGQYSFCPGCGNKIKR